MLACVLLTCGGDAPNPPTGPTTGSTTPGAPAAPAPDPTPPAPVPASIRFRVVTWNVQHGYTPDKRHVNQEQIAFIAGLRPDVVALQELAEWDNDMPTMYRQGLESMTGKRWSWRYQASVPGAPPNLRDGSALGSSLGVSSQDVLMLGDTSASNDPNKNRAAIRFSISDGNVRVDLVTTHLDYLDGANRRSQLDRIQAWLARGSATRIVAGDFNAEPGDAMTWSGWQGEYADAWLSPANTQGGSPGFTMPLRSTTGRPGRIDYQWSVNAQPVHVEVVQTSLSDHHALVVDWVVTAK